MRRFLKAAIFTYIVAWVTAGNMLVPAQAEPQPVPDQPIVRLGSSYDGVANANDPGECDVFVHENRDTDEAHVNCRWADYPTRVRYRFLRDVGATFDPARVNVRWSRHGGDCSGTAVSWRVMRNNSSSGPRTVRVVVKPRCYMHIERVIWRQP